MGHTLTIRSKGGFENFIKISSTLKRKQFSIDHMSLNHFDSEHFEMEVTLLTNHQPLAHAIRYIKKNEDVYEIIEK